MLAREEVKRAFRIHTAYRFALFSLHLVEIERNLDVGHHGRFDAVVQLAHPVLDVLVRFDVFALAEVLTDQLVQQPAVDVVAHAEREDSGSNFVLTLGVFDDLHFVGFAGGGKAIGQEQYVTGLVVVLQLAQRRFQGPVDVGAAASIDAFDESQRGFAILVIVALQFRPERFHLAVVSHDVEQVAVAEIVQHVFQRTAGLFDLLAAHTARAIHHEDDRLPRPLGVFRFDLGTGQEQEESVLVVLRPIADHASADLAAAHVVQKTEVGRGDFVLLGQGHHRVVVVGPFDIHTVRWAVDVLDFVLALDRRAYAELLNRVRGVFGCGQWEEEVGQAVLFAAHLRVTHRHGPLRPGRDGKDARLEQPRAHPFQQRWVLVLTDNVLVQPPGLLGV